jgi:hypothetical protein
VEATVSAESAVVVAEPCAQCGMPLAHDQRYCLECGSPRTYLSGLHQLDGLRATAGPPPGGALYAPSGGAPLVPPSQPYQQMPAYPYYPAAGATPGNAGSRWGGLTGLIAGVGVLLLAMGVGVLIGRSGASSGKVTTAPPQVITLDQSGSSDTTTGATTGQTPTPGSAAHNSRKPHSKSSSHGGQNDSSGGVGNSIEKPAPPSVLKDEKSKNGESFVQKSKNLPNVISTG